jgi:hypothetical protein
MEQLDETQTPLEEVNPPAAASAPVLFDETETTLNPASKATSSQADGEAAEVATQGEATEQHESRTFRKLREISNAALKDKRRLERELEEIRAKLPKPEPTLGPKPTLDQFDYDESKYEEAFAGWMARKAPRMMRIARSWMRSVASRKRSKTSRSRTRRAPILWASMTFRRPNQKLARC